jgi:hypothetical protein
VRPVAIERSWTESEGWMKEERGRGKKREKANGKVSSLIFPVRVKLFV